MSTNTTIWQTHSWWKMLIRSWQAEKIFEIEWIKVEKRKVSMWEYWLFVLWIENKINKKVEQKLIELCKKENCLFIQIETNNYSTSPQPYPYKENEKNTVFKKWYYKKFITPYTAVIDLNLSEEDILANMKPKGRYNIKLAIKKWVEVKVVDKTDQNIKAYYDLMMETTSRDWFSWNSLEYYKTFLNSLDNSKLLLAYSEDTVIAWGIFIIDSETSIYYYWASTSDKTYRNLMAPYLLQWTAIAEAKKNWSKIYDLLWVAWKDEKNSPLAWVTDFKMKLTKDIREVSSSYIFINKSIKYYIIEILRKLNK